MTVGQVVYSKSGRDKGLAFVVVREAGSEYVFLADGRLRSLDKPKKKKLKHIQPTLTVIPSIQTALLAGDRLLDADIRKALVPFKRDV